MCKQYTLYDSKYHYICLKFEDKVGGGLYNSTIKSFLKLRGFFCVGKSKNCHVGLVRICRNSSIKIMIDIRVNKHSSS